MNKKYLIIIISILTFLACNNVNVNKNEVSADQINQKTIETKYYKIDYNSVVFKKNSNPINIVNDSVNNFINSEIKAFTKSIDIDIKEIIDSNEINAKYELNINTNNYITTFGYVSIVFEIYSYTLGAHGNSTFKSINYDIINNKFVSLNDISKIEDKINLGKFNSLLNKYFVNTDSCFTKKPSIKKDFNTFSIQEDSIVVYFAPCELGAYACGSSKVYIPIKELP